MKEFDPELVSGSIFRSVWKLAWPVITLQLLSGIHGFVDHILVGHFVEDYAANAAIGVSWQLFLVMVVFIASLFHGMGIMIARYSGRQDRHAVNRVFYETSLSAFWILVLIAAPLGYFFTPNLLDLANASPEVRAYAQPYLRTLFTLSAPLFLTFMLNSAFQATGDPKTPLKLGILTTLLNVVISYLLITGPGPFPELGVLGAAIGTVAAPMPGVVIAIWLIAKHKTILGPPGKFTLVPDFKILKTVARLGIPTGIQAVLLNVAGAILLGFVGSLDHSAEAQAAYTICYAQLFSFVTWASFGLRASSATIMGQNLGAGKPERARNGVYVTTMMALVWAGIWAAVYWTLPDALLWLFKISQGSTVYEIGEELLSFLAFSAFFVAAALAITGGLQGAGDTKTPMYIAFLSQIVVLLGMCFVFQRMGILTATLIWTAVLTSHFIRFLFTAVMFQRGHWSNITVEYET